ncbi:unnamed protein product [Effrenium voratum]|uniref:Uncharacterized protein n=1 Tax=Effrenium voratum TaxID=2562239 RepID=A0AA36J176_9DINO|nr:unnamed protein product [Effrenium voratum]CAJ1429291.1 unnamed protein product [Effrenium voratum]CAJ1452862.1 unnamed protein product [Effrenium voratum]|mmetsp:Transcript_34100/g.81844  ORF Transcript_34100/g.81844 Transcript_34100/m.81844 type:complete len:144 (-) Transcript_34100:296-727(-)|eukprot:CAMPEP_0181470538 /NCGR_PEP_ID=MMETSP1110-20121109/38604_1 /TAXON_ID=174948 /ORGANISM="Symbiodinium sp., Strain CCMP421" /LENGTH=143 /DNA_ID=CAMNT_0023595515 /DNA_START=60 /DNA_END=491 /DNA_ORIENTATION=+
MAALNLSFDMFDAAAYETDSDSNHSQSTQSKVRLSGTEFLSASPSRDGLEIGAQIRRSVLSSQSRNRKVIAPPPKEPAPIFIAELPPSMKVPTPLVSAGLNPFIPAKKRLSFADELGESNQGFQFISEPVIIRASDLASLRQA